MQHIKILQLCYRSFQNKLQEDKSCSECHIMMLIWNFVIIETWSFLNFFYIFNLIKIKLNWRNFKEVVYSVLIGCCSHELASSCWEGSSFLCTRAWVCLSRIEKELGFNTLQLQISNGTSLGTEGLMSGTACVYVWSLCGALCSCFE